MVSSITSSVSIGNVGQPAISKQRLHPQQRDFAFSKHGIARQAARSRTKACMQEYAAKSSWTCQGCMEKWHTKKELFSRCKADLDISQAERLAGPADLHCPGHHLYALL